MIQNSFGFSLNKLIYMPARHFTDKNQTFMSRLFIFNKFRCANILSSCLHRCYTKMQVVFFAPISVREVLVHCNTPMKRKYCSFCCFFCRSAMKVWFHGADCYRFYLKGSSSAKLFFFLRIRVNKDELIELSFVRHTTTA